MLQQYYPIITRCEDDQDVTFSPTVEYFYYPSARARCERGTGLVLEPSEDAIADIYRVHLNDSPFILTNEELSILEEELTESVQ